jgi:hypothetical protein
MLVIAAGLAASNALPAAEPGDDGLMPMFDGKTFAGWRKVGGGATYTIAGDEIVGKVGPGANTFLRTERPYGNFLLKLELKLDIPGNSGIQFRSHQQPSKDGDGRVFGYQCEVDPSTRAWSGGLYDEARRGWLYPLEGHADAQKAFKVSDWNQYTILACGPHLQTWLNGVPCADLLDAMDLEGFIALQVHAGKEGQIRWRNVRIKDLGQSTWKPLWDGKSLAGWSTQGGDWKVEDGVLHATQTRTAANDALLATEGRYTDFVIHLKFKEAQGRVGLRLLTGDRALRWNHSGHETPKEPTSKKAAPKAVEPADGWHELAGMALGNRLVVQLDGLTIVDHREEGGRTPGRIALALPSGQEGDVVFKDVEVLPLDGTQCP